MPIMAWGLAMRISINLYSLTQVSSLLSFQDSGVNMCPLCFSYPRNPLPAPSEPGSEAQSGGGDKETKRNHVYVVTLRVQEVMGAD